MGIDFKDLIKRPPSLADQAYRAIRDAILSRALPPNHRMTEREAAEGLGVSRTPVREALNRLERDGLIESMEHSGIRVLPISVADVIESYVCRAALEALAVSLVVERRDRATLQEIRACVTRAEAGMRGGNLEEVLEWNSRFHQTFIKLSGNKRLGSLHEVVNVPIDRYRRLLLSLVQESPSATEEYTRFVRRSLQAHAEITRALAAGPRERAVGLMREHVLATGQDLAAGFRIANREKIVASGVILDNEDGRANLARSEAAERSK